jgi:ankyrin repeat protein
MNPLEISVLRYRHTLFIISLATFMLPGTVFTQVAPTASERAVYHGLLRASAEGDVTAVERLLSAGATPDVRDGRGRTPLHIATFAGHHAVMRTLVAGGADPNALEHDRYDIVTIAAVANDLPTMERALELGCGPGNITSIYDGTALIAAAHLGHAEVVERLARAGAPLDHVNNLGWTAVIESIVLGDGGPSHLRTLAVLLDAGANVNITDGRGRTPLALAKAYGHTEMVRLIEAADGR